MDDVGLGLHAERRIVMLVEHDAVDADGSHNLYCSMNSLYRRLPATGSKCLLEKVKAVAR